MNLAYNLQLIPDLTQKNAIRQFLENTYWDNDIWVYGDSAFDDYRNCYKQEKGAKLIFSGYYLPLRDELKYFFAQRILCLELKLSSIFGDYRFTAKYFCQFLSLHYPKLESFTEIVVDEMVPKWKLFLSEKGLRADRAVYRAQLYQPYLFFSDFYDTRSEYEKDIWDVRKIGMKLPVNATNYLLNFTQIPLQMRQFVQRYMKLRITILSLSRCREELFGITYFLSYLIKKESQWHNLNNLSRNHIEDYLVFFSKTKATKKRGSIEMLLNVRTFLSNIQKYSYPEAPLAPAPSLLFDEDIPQIPFLSPMSNRVKYISDSVILQLREHLEHLSPAECIPIVVLLMASGWRISDVLNLRYDTCLEHTPQGWYLHGDIQKTNVIDHRVPVTDEVSVVVQTVAELAKSKSTPENNPLHLLFNRYSGKRIGRSPEGKRISEALNRLAKKYNIVNDQGQVHHFKLHAFRHTKGVELINGGMSLVHVQKWMAHMSPEMTLVYAKILDSTLRKSWEEATKNGLFRIEPSGILHRIDISDIENEDLIEWEYIRHNLDAVRMPLGYCMKPKKQECYTQLNPCLTCRNLCTTPDFLPQYEVEASETKLLIERGQSQGREVWAQKNQCLLTKYQEIIHVLKSGKTHHLAGKNGREYLGKERANGNT